MSIGHFGWFPTLSAFLAKLVLSNLESELQGQNISKEIRYGLEFSTGLCHNLVGKGAPDSHGSDG